MSKCYKCDRCGTAYTENNTPHTLTYGLLRSQGSNWRATKYCSDKCKREGLRRCESEARKRRKTGIYKAKNKGMSSLAMMARKEGMSYGQYVAKHGC